MATQLQTISTTSRVLLVAAGIRNSPDTNWRLKTVKGMHAPTDFLQLNQNIALARGGQI